MKHGDRYEVVGEVSGNVELGDLICVEGSEGWVRVERRLTVSQGKGSVRLFFYGSHDRFIWTVDNEEEPVTIMRRVL